MCLHKITKRISKPSTKIHKGWKFFVNSGELRFPIMHARVQRGKWLKAKSKQVGDEPLMYKSGFHAFVTQKSAKVASGSHGWYTQSRPVMEVLLRGVRTIGKEYRFHKWVWAKAKMADGMYKTYCYQKRIWATVMVADEMYVPAKDEKIVGNRIVKIPKVAKRKERSK